MIQVDDKTALLHSKYVLDMRSWVGLNNWLHEEFYFQAFDWVNHEALGYYANGQYRASSILVADADKYYDVEYERRAQATAYAQSRGVKTNEEGYCKYWLMDYGESSVLYGAHIFESGSIGEAEQKTPGIGIRPVVRINLNKLRSLESFERPEKQAEQNSADDGWTYPPEYAVGNIVKFGHYEQDNKTSNGKEPIEWHVLAHDGKKAFLTSKYGLDVKRYHERNEPVTWETCTLRAWLNDEFYKAAFNQQQQDMIVLTEVHSNVGNEVMDKVFVLSIEEADKYFANEEARRIGSTKYARKRGAFDDGNTRAYWWTRTRGDHEEGVMLFGVKGSQAYIDNKWYWECGYYDYRSFSDQVTVRPALWVDMEKIAVSAEASAHDEGQAETMATAETQGKIRIMGSGTVNVRQKSNADSKRVGYVRTGDVYEYVDIAQNGWVKIVLNNGTEGYISGKLVEFEE